MTPLFVYGPYAAQSAVYALDVATGTVQGHFADHVLAPVAVGDALYANTSTHPTAALLALDPLIGIPRWHYEITGRLFSAPVVAERAILLGASEGFVDAVDPRDGTLRWRHTTGGILFGPPAIAADVAYCSPAPGGSGRAAVFALRLDDGAQLWRADLPHFTSHPLTVAGGTVYVGAHNTCYALNAASGERRGDLAPRLALAHALCPCSARLRGWRALRRVSGD